MKQRVDLGRGLGALDVSHACDAEQAQLTYELELNSEQAWFQGHFPEYPILPGVVQLHTLVLCVLEQFWKDLGPVQSVKRLKYTCPLHPGDRIQGRIERRLGVGQASFELMRVHPTLRLAATGVLVFGPTFVGADAT